MKTISILFCRQCFYILLFILITLCCQVGLAQNELNDKAAIPLHSLPDLKIWVDSFNQGSISTLQAVDFQSAANFSLEEVTASYWVQFSLNNPQSIAQEYWLNTSVFDSLTLISIRESDTLVQHFGLLVHYEEAQKQEFRTLQKDKYGITILIPAQQERQFYLRLKNVVRFESSFEEIKLYPAEAYSREIAIWSLLFHAIFFGVLIFVALFTFIQFFQNKDFAYWYYTLYLLLSTVYFWWKFEKANSFINIIFTESLEWYYYLEIPMCMAIYISYLFFIIHFINAKQEIPVIYRLLKIVSGLLVIYVLLDRTILLSLGFSFSWEIYFVLRILIVGFGLVVFYMIVHAKAKLAFYLVSGSLTVLLGSLITGYLSKAMTQHYWAGWDLPLIPIQLATLLEILFFSIGLGYKSRLLVKEQVQMKQMLAMEQKITEQERTSKEQLSNWFTNISHEFRTPLMIIKGLTNQIIEQPNFHLQKRLSIVQRNTHSLEVLVTQLLDLSKLDSGVLSVQKERDDIIKYLGYLTESFHSLAFEKKINLSFYSKIDSQIMAYDAEMVKQILSNLLFNSLKFTPEYGKIIAIAEVITAEKVKEWMHRTSVANQVSIGTMQSTNNYLHLIVKDSGVGIASEKLPFIFNRFFQVTSLSQETKGTGIGLSLTKELVLLLDGMIHVESTHKKGSTFSVFLPMEQTFSEEQSKRVENSTVLPIEDASQSTASITKYPTIVKDSEKPLLLIVEDNADVIYYIKTCTQDTYTVLEARNGKEGMERAIEVLPDIIISDVMMPIMDGYELCKALKQDIRTSHIPCLLLTAKATQACKNQGLKAGASAYLIKPFAKEELLIRLQNLILWKTQLQAFIKLESNKRKQLAPPTNSDIEIKFLQEVDKQIYKHLDEESFKAAQLARAMTMSETQLYRKLKAVTNQSIAQYIRSIRLTEAYELLETTNASVGTIATKVGFKQLSHFSKVFQKQFKIRPSDLRK